VKTPAPGRGRLVDQAFQAHLRLLQSARAARTRWLSHSARCLDCDEEQTPPLCEVGRELYDSFQRARAILRQSRRRRRPR
jgi:hypothetical protein